MNLLQTGDNWTDLLEQRQEEKAQRELNLYNEPEIDPNLTPNYGGPLNYG